MQNQKKFIAGHQPEFFPYIGYWKKMSIANKFVLVDSINYQPKNFQNRNQIRVGNGSDKVCWLKIPIIKDGDIRYQKINQVLINNNTDWKNSHLHLIQQSYKKTKYFNDVYPFINTLYNYDTPYLSQFTSNIICKLSDKLNIKEDISSTSSTLINSKKNNLLIDICNEYGCDGYLSGMGAKDYVDISLFDKNKLEHHFIKIDAPEYNTKWKPFVPNMCILDILFNLGFDGTQDYIKNQVQYMLI